MDEVGRGNFETTTDPTDLDEPGDPNVPWDTVVGDGWGVILAVEHPLLMHQGTDAAKAYFDIKLSSHYPHGTELHTYVGKSEIFGHDAARYEHRFPGPFFFDSSEETETLFVTEFALDNPFLVRSSGYQGPVGGNLSLGRMNAITDFGGRVMLGRTYPSLLRGTSR